MPSGSRARVAAAFVVTVLLWASAFPVLRVALRTFSPPHLTLLRFLCASVTMALIVLVARVPVPPRREMGRLLAVALLGAVGYHVSLNFGLRTVSAAAGSLIVNLSPVLTAVLARSYLRERLGPRGVGGLAMAVVGGVVIASGEMAAQAGGVRVSPQGILLLVLAAASWSVSTIVQKPLLRRLSAMQVATWSVFLGTPPLLALAGGLPGAVAAASPAALGAVAYLGAAPIGIAYLTWIYCLHRMPASRLAAATYVLPVVAMLMAWVWPGEAPKAATAIGGGIALLGVVLVTTERQPGPRG